jgi:hypothetical protein
MVNLLFLLEDFKSVLSHLNSIFVAQSASPPLLIKAFLVLKEERNKKAMRSASHGSE